MIEIKEGQVFGHLKVVKEAPRKRLPSGQVNRVILCKCECGAQKEIRLLHLVRGRIVSCGCRNGEKHGMAKTKLYRVWSGMHVRCYTDTCVDRHRYKDRGIEMCPEWKASFTAFKEWASLNGYKSGLQIDRIDNSKGYSPDNCRFVTPMENCNNRDVTTWVVYNGETVSLQLLLRQKNIHHHLAAIRTRITRGWRAQKAIDTPIRKGNYVRKYELQAN